jgi:hypothetical protein
MSRSKAFMVTGAGLVLLLAPLASARAQAGGLEATSCVRTFGSFSCVTRWGPAVDPNIRYAPPPRDEREAAEVAARVRQWEARCRPIIRPDQYGVGRYWYAAPACEHGVVSD